MRIGPCLQLSLAVVQGQAKSAEGEFPGVVLCRQRGWRLQKESVTCLFINIFPRWRFCEACSGCVRGKGRVEGKAWVRCVWWHSRLCHACLYPRGCSAITAYSTPLSPAFPRQGCHLAFLLGCYFSHRGCDKPSGGGLGGVKRAENMIKKFCMTKISNKNNREEMRLSFWSLPQQTKPKPSVFPGSSFLSAVMKVLCPFRSIGPFPLTLTPSSSPPHTLYSSSHELTSVSAQLGYRAGSFELFFLPLSQ